MTHASFDKTAMLYNFVEKRICDDYSSACNIINEYLTLESEEKIIDVGGGTGLVAKVLRSKKQNDEIMVIDLSRSMLQKVNDPTLSLAQGDVTAFPLKDETFTLAILVNTLHHVYETKQQVALQEIFRILKKQGRIFIIEIWHSNTFFSNLFVNIEKILVGKTHHLTPDKMQLAIQDAGFHGIKVFFPKKYPTRYVTTAIK
jgi:ubiquinone/menaquinone biosynthesis C-methylase UbiE